MLMVDSDYELLPEKDILKIKRELNELKENELSSKFSPEKIEELNNNIKELIEVIRLASDEVKLEKVDPYIHRLSVIEKKIDKSLYENKEIAQGIVALADLINKPAPPPVQHPAAPAPPMEAPANPPMPLGSGQNPSPHPPGAPPMPPPLNPPPGPGMPAPIMPMPPAGKPQKKGLFGGMFKKK